MAMVLSVVPSLGADRPAVAGSRDSWSCRVPQKRSHCKSCFQQRSGRAGTTHL